MITGVGPPVEDESYNKIFSIIKMKEFEIKLQEELKKCIKQHQNILYVCRVVDDIFSTIMLIILSFSVGHIIFILYASISVREQKFR